MGFALFILTHAALFIRPGEIIPELQDWSIYHALILSCIVVSYPRLLNQLTWKSLEQQPITLCVVGLWVTVVASHLSRLFLSGAIDVGTAFGKVVIYYLLLVSLVDSPGRLRVLLSWLIGFIVVAAALAVLQHHGVLTLPGLTNELEVRHDEQLGVILVAPRLTSTGIFNDPNDFSLILGLGVLLCLYQSGNRAVGGFRWLWLPPVVLFGYTIHLTQSRGGLLALLLGLLVLFRSRFGWWMAGLLALLLVPAALFLAGERQTNFDLSNKEDTSQHRIKLWAEGLILFQRSPVFGIGAKQYADEVGLVAHNSFVHAYTELGFLGGTLFANTFVLALWGLVRLSSSEDPDQDPELMRFRPFLTGIVAGYAVGLFSLSRNYVEPTYLILGLATIYLRLTTPASPNPLRSDKETMAWMGVIGVGSIVIIYVSVRLLANYA